MSKFKLINWNPECIPKVFTVETMEKTKFVFNNTHIPINKLKIEAANSGFLKIVQGSVGGFINEDQLFQYLAVYPVNEKRVIIIKGSPGSGKSELSQSINFHFKGSQKIVPIIFQRSKLYLKDIFTNINEQFGLSLEYKSLIEDYGEIIAADYINVHTKMLLKDYFDRGKVLNESDKTINDEDSFLILRRIVERKEFKKQYKTFLENSVKKYAEQIEKYGDMKIEFKLGDEFKNFLKKEFHKNEKKAKEIVEDISHITEKVIHDFQEIPSFSDIVNQVYDKIGGNKKILLIFEDATGFGFAEKLINFVFDRQLKPCDIIIGWTDGYIQRMNLESTNYRDRTSAVLSTSSDEKSFFLNENIILELAKKHLNTLKEISKKFLDNEVIETAKTIEPFFDGLYPFNKTILLRIYETLQEDGQKQQTPRVFLTKSLKDILDYEKIPMSNPAHFTIPKHHYKFSTENKYRQLFSIAYLYGTSLKGDSKKLNINPHIFKYLGYEISDEIKLELSTEGFVFTENEIIIPLKIALEDVKIIQEIEEAQPQDEEAQTQDEFTESMQDFADWLSGKELKKKDQLKTGIKNLFNAIYNNKFNQIGIFSYSQIFLDIDKPLENRPEIRILIQKKTDADKEILSMCLLYLGVLGKDFTDHLDDSINLSNIIQWVKGFKDGLDKQFFKKLDTQIGFNFNKLIIYLKCFFLFLNHYKSKITYEDLIKEKIENGFINSFFKKCPKCGTKIESFFCKKCKFILNPTISIDIMEDLETTASDIEAIFTSLFKISSDFYNYQLLNEVFKEIATDNCIQLNNKILNKLKDIRNISDYRMNILISGSEVRISEFIGKVKELIEKIANNFQSLQLKKSYKENTESLIKKIGELNLGQIKKDKIESSFKTIKKLNSVGNYAKDIKIDISKINENFQSEYDAFRKKWQKYIQENNNDFFETNILFIEINKFLKGNYETYKELIKIFDIKDILKRKLDHLTSSNEGMRNQLLKFYLNNKKCEENYKKFKEVVKNFE